MRTLSPSEIIFKDLQPLPEDLWNSLRPIFEKQKSTNRYEFGGRPKQSNRIILAAIVCRVEYGVSWEKLPKRYGKESTIRSRYKQWVQDGTLKACKNAISNYYMEKYGIELDWGILDGKRKDLKPEKKELDI